MFSENQQIGNYTLVKRIGRGGFGEVWLAERRTALLTTKVAVKLPLDAQIDLETVRQEAVLWEKASGHPNVLPIIEADIYDEQVIIVSEFAPDGSLADLLKTSGKIPVPKAVEIAGGITAGLEFLHSRRIIHRDIKPQNILLQGDTPRLADFGISHALQTSVASRSANIKGTFSYMAPEAFDGKRNEQTDIWAVGVVLYQMLKGDLPFPQTDTTALFGAIIMREPEPLADEIPSKLKEIVGKALAKQPENRFPTAREMREELQKALVGISHPSFAPTEVLHITEKPEIKTDATDPTVLLPTAGTNFPSIQTKVQPTQSEKQTEQFTRPAVEVRQFSEAPSIVTRAAPSQTVAEDAKPLPTVAQAVAGRTQASRGFNKLYFIAPLVLLVVLFTGGYFFLKNRLGIFNSGFLTTVEANQLIPYRKGFKWGFCDARKKIHIAPTYEFPVQPFSDELALVRGNGEYGYIDKTGYFVIKLDYNSQATSFSEGFAIVMSGSPGSYKFGFIDKTGKSIVQPKYKSVEPFSEGLAKVCIEDRMCGFIDRSGKEVIPPKYEKASSFSEDLAVVREPNKSGVIFIDKTGNIVLRSAEYDAAAFSEGLSATFSGNYLDKTGKVVLQTETDARSFHEGLAAARNGVAGKWGFIDKTGKMVIQPQYDSVGEFSEGLAAVIIGEQGGFIDQTGNLVIPLKYKFQSFELPKFKNGIAKVDSDNGEIYIGKDGTAYFEN